MPRIPDHLLDVAIYLYPSADAARNGEQVGGTGFLAGFYTNGQTLLHLYAVTCAHVIADGCPVIRINTRDDKWDIIEIEQADWLQDVSGTDLAVCPIQLSDQHRFGFVGIDDFLDHQNISEFAIGPGDDVFMVGRFINHEGKQQNRPTLRFGNISMMPWELIRGWQGVPQESFLVDMRSRTGFSGSPVFVYIAPTDIRLGVEKWTSQQASTFYGPWLLGVDWGHIPIYSKVLGPKIDSYGNRLPVDASWDVPVMSGVCGVIPAWKLTKLLLEDADLNAQRSEKIEAARKKGDAVLDSASGAKPPTTDENPRHKEDFNSLLDAAVKGPQSDDQT
ncbi:MAG: trypsin-like peptidase domain-containing protein [Planctomycetes bacterium]|nr:trypsin-like peptidase domain-containing protein [Planctomycetota bacterium]